MTTASARKSRAGKGTRSDAELERRALAAYWGMAVGDALGATVEFLIPREIRQRYGIHDQICGGGWLHLPKGQVTDDTEMALALGDAILADQGVQPLTIADRFDRWLRSRPRDVGNTVRRGILHYRNTGGAEVPESSDAGNGACMRTLPVALAMLFSAPDSIAQASIAQAHVTHNNPLSDAACLAVIEMVQSGMKGTDKVALLNGPIARLRASSPEFGFRGRQMENPSGFIVDTMQAVLQGFIDTDDYAACLIDVVNRGGDADTTGAIVGMIAGAYYGLDELPERWLREMDSGVLEACKAQSIALLELAHRDHV